ncbi:hypothetical protein VOLCADRAFT_117226 [Volvox carteri f. nagariensis]|uniref:Thioesterase domain-containing protein n=1 Tax=Volvox carteri f. nagariensis TaxID=3068 RepID=D8TST3_VOLCA|nr:uncharacterized protein VOLCADRAFT_117226 [Volvox carteri f. nagariensis]EFJ49429.1 hypothetical protein VOLCADRAFT_117226 [Volvox carteri f. nagariensis]|eukprot:XP_002949410.1 hypothetical protein VOLCADRAFT_117226 [Volvox carteri f. nagariensis]
MSNKPFSLALRALHLPIPHVRLSQQQQQGHQLRARGQLCIAAAQAHVGPVLQVLAKTGARWGGSAVLFAGAAYALAQSNRAPDSEGTGDLSSEAIPWVRQLAETEGVEEVLSPGQQLRKHPVGKMVVEQDHLFETMVASGQIKELRCFYDTRRRIFYSVVELGREVCGFPQTVHGGLTAALVDETAGGLAVALWRAGDLGFRPPAYTARLEVDYKRRRRPSAYSRKSHIYFLFADPTRPKIKQKIPNGQIILIATEVEQLADRKVWLRAKVTNGKGAVYATGRALFVAPRWLPDWLRSLTGGRRDGGRQQQRQQHQQTAAEVARA